jgi:NADPH:quinone reductase-like Zn-dependent oxidoreductase
MSNQAAYLDGKGKTFRVDSAEVPKPKDNEVVIKNHAIAINPVDWKVQDTGMFIKSWPIVLGCDVAGEIVEVGSSVKHLQKGDRVMGHAISLASQDSRNGGFQLYTACQAAVTAKIPDSTSYSEASVLPLALDTAAAGLYGTRQEGFMGLEKPTLTPIQSGKTLVVYGASSSVGALVIQLAVASGVYVIAVASERNHEFCRSLGASETFDYKSSSIVDDISKAIKASEPRNFIGVYDTISNADSYKITVPVMEKAGAGNLAVTLPGPEKVPEAVKIGNVFGITETTHPVWESYVPEALQQGKLKCVPEPLVVGKGLENVQKGCDKNKEGVSAKKVVIEL